MANEFKYDSCIDLANNKIHGETIINENIRRVDNPIIRTTNASSSVSFLDLINIGSFENFGFNANGYIYDESESNNKKLVQFGPMNFESSFNYFINSLNDYFNYIDKRLTFLNKTLNLEI